LQRQESTFLAQSGDNPDAHDICSVIRGGTTMTGTADDADLIAGVRAGNEDAFEARYRFHKDAMHADACSLAGVASTPTICCRKPSSVSFRRRRRSSQGGEALGEEALRSLLNGLPAR
jgi:hypothetical protein